MARINTSDLPPVTDIPANELEEIRGAGRRSFRPSFEALEDRYLLSASVLSNAIAGQPEQFTVGSDSQLTEMTASGPRALCGNLQSIESGVDATGRDALFALLTDGTLGEYTAGGAWSEVDSNIQSIGASASGTLYELQNGTIYKLAAGSWSTMDHNIQSFAVTASGTLYELQNGTIYKLAAGSWSTMDHNIQSFSVTANGTFYELQNGTIYKLAGGSWNQIERTHRAYPG